MKSKITFFLMLVLIPVIHFMGNNVFARTVSGAASITGCQNSGTITAYSSGLGTTPQYQLLLSASLIYPVPADATQSYTTNTYTNLAIGTYTVRGKENSSGKLYDSPNIVVNDSYSSMTITIPTKVLRCSGGRSTLTLNTTGGKSPYVFKIALQSSTSAFIETSTSHSTISYIFESLIPLSTVNHVLNLGYNCGTPITGATSIMNPSVSLNELNITAYFNLTVLTDFNSIINSNNEMGFVYSVSGNPIEAAHAANTSTTDLYPTAVPNETLNGWLKTVLPKIG